MTESEGSGERYRIRTRPEDFVVVEEPLYPPAGEGGHTFVWIEKRGLTTEQLARALASVCGVAPGAVGYAGRKDRHALTRQWLSVPDLEPERALELELPEARVLEAHRHRHKLKTGQLRGNRFEIVLRGRGEADLATARRRAAELTRRGLPNRFGAQRFGRAGDNAERGRALLAGGAPPRDRRHARFLLSALQSEVFNAVLDDRGDAYDGVESGDLARVEASGGLFWVEDADRERPRAEAFEISATGPIFGTRMRAPRGGAGERERQLLASWGIPEPDAMRLPRGLRAKGARRPLRVRPRELEVSPLAGEPGLRVRCGLPSGAYVTVLIEALVGPVLDASREARPAEPRVGHSPDAPSAAGVSCRRAGSRAPGPSDDACSKEGGAQGDGES